MEPVARSMLLIVGAWSEVGIGKGMLGVNGFAEINKRLHFFEGFFILAKCFFFFSE